MCNFGIVAFRNYALCDVAENVIFLGMKKVRQSEMTPDGIKLTLYLSEKGPLFSPVPRKCAGENNKTPQTLLALNTFKANIEIAPHHTVVKRQNCTNSMPKKSLVFVFVSFSAHYTI